MDLIKKYELSIYVDLVFRGGFQCDSRNEKQIDMEHLKLKNVKK